MEFEWNFAKWPIKFGLQPRSEAIEDRGTDLWAEKKPLAHAQTARLLDGIGASVLTGAKLAFPGFVCFLAVFWKGCQGEGFEKCFVRSLPWSLLLSVGLGAVIAAGHFWSSYQSPHPMELMARTLEKQMCGLSKSDIVLTASGVKFSHSGAKQMALLELWKETKANLAAWDETRDTAKADRALVRLSKEGASILTKTFQETAKRLETVESKPKEQHEVKKIRVQCKLPGLQKKIEKPIKVAKSFIKYFSVRRDL